MPFCLCIRNIIIFSITFIQKIRKLLIIMTFTDSKAPMVVAFTAGVTESKSYWSSGNLIFSTIIYNEGGAYDASTGVFTSPTDGIFVFYVTITAYSSNTISVDIVKNRSSSVRALAYGGSSYQTGTNMAVFSLGRGDKVWVKQHSGQGFYTASTPITSFTGFMISWGHNLII